jgi:competence protein ComEA
LIRGEPFVRAEPLTIRPEPATATLPVSREPDAAWPDVGLPRNPGGGLPSRLSSRLAAWLRERGVRLDPGHRAGVAMGLAALVAALVAGWWVLSSRPHAVPVSTSRAPGSSPVGSGSPSSTASGRLVVDVVGKVRRPGVYRVADGARVDDALRMAGGALPGVELSSLNLARKVVDGEQIAVGVAGAGGAAPPGGPPATGPVAGGPTGAAPGAPVNLNTATVQQLDALPGIGPVLAQRILDWRTAHGRFASVDQLREVNGIGPSRFDDLKPLVAV